MEKRIIFFFDKLLNLLITAFNKSIVFKISRNDERCCFLSFLLRYLAESLAKFFSTSIRDHLIFSSYMITINAFTAIWWTFRSYMELNLPHLPLFYLETCCPTKIYLRILITVHVLCVCISMPDICIRTAILICLAVNI